MYSFASSEKSEAVSCTDTGERNFCAGDDEMSCASDSLGKRSDVEASDGGLTGGADFLSGILGYTYFANAVVLTDTSTIMGKLMLVEDEGC